MPPLGRDPIGFFARVLHPNLLMFLVATAILAVLILLAGSTTMHWLHRAKVTWRAAGRWGVWLFGSLVVSLVVRLILWARYRPLKLTEEERQRLPRLTVVIPAFNEGPMVKRSIESVVQSHYRRGCLNVVVVNDGSRDDTGMYIDEVAKRHPKVVTAIHLPTNQGKRHALYEGFQRALSDGAEIVATVDSDSIVPEESLAAMAVPFLRSERVGAVAGKVQVFNRYDNVLTRMLGVRYILGFDFTRAYQSQLKTVWCCPGALQAYRMSVIADELEVWRDQLFLGAPCTNGDDHAMTTTVLSKGYDSVYQSSAVVETIVPRTYKGLTKMYTRWGRSATREGLRALTFAPTRALSLGSLRGPLVLMDAVMQPLTIFVRLVGVLAGSWFVYLHPHALVFSLEMTTAWAVIYGLIYLKSERSAQVIYGILYAWFAMVALMWVQPFATLTVRRNGWLTRK